MWWQPHPNHNKTMLLQPDSESPQPVAEAESLVGVATHDLLAALEVMGAAKLDLGNAVKQAVEKAVERWHDRWPGKVLPVITVKTSPEIVCGGRPRRVTAHVTVDFFR